MLKYKVDWLAFSVSFDDEEQTLDPQILKMLGYDLADFDEIPGRFFYNAGATYRNYVNVFWNDPDKPRPFTPLHFRVGLKNPAGCVCVSDI